MYNVYTIVYTKSKKNGIYIVQELEASSGKNQ